MTQRQDSQRSRRSDRRARASRAEQMAAQILTLARREGLEPGARLVEQRLADALGVSRGPVRAGLKQLAASGVAKGERNVGFVLTKRVDSVPAMTALAASAPSDAVYRQIARDRLEGHLPPVVTEAELMRRYAVTRAELVRLLERITGEGWIERQRGYGWRFAVTLASPEAYRQSSTFRGVIEPAALLDTGYSLEAAVIARLREQQTLIFDRGFDGLTVAEIFQSGCDFHEGIIRGAPNPFYLEALRRVNAIRRLFAYRTYADVEGLRRHVREHLRLLDLIAAGRMADAARLMSRHLSRPIG